MKSAPQFKATLVIDQKHAHSTLSSFQSSTISSMSSTMFGKRHAEFALSLFCKSAVKVLLEQGIEETPSEEQLFALIMRDAFGDEEKYEELSSTSKNIPRDDVAKKDEEPEVVQEVQVPLAEAPKKKISNLTSKDLKKNPLKITKKDLNDDGAEVEVEVEIAFPYLAEVDYSDTCQSLKVNGGLFTPCLTRPAKGSTFCKTCAKANHKYGTMEKRSNCSMLCYVDPNGKKEISYGTWLAKRSLERASVESKIEEQYGITLPEEYWLVENSKASRAVKTVSTSSDDEASVESEKLAPKKAGRTKKKSVEPVEEETQSVEPVEVIKSVESKKSKSVEAKKSKRGRPKKVVIEAAEDSNSVELEEEQVSDIETHVPKNGTIRKIEHGVNLIYYEKKEYFLDMDDNDVYEYEFEKCEVGELVGTWDAEVMQVEFF